MNDIGDRLAIQDLRARWGESVNSRDEGMFRALWDENGEWKLFDPEPIVGRDSIVAAWLKALAQFPRAMMFMSPGHLAIAGDTATGKVYNFEVGATADGRNIRIFSSYDDAYVKRDGQWLFARRTFSLMHMEDYRTGE